MSKLTAPMRTALLQARQGPLRRAHEPGPGRPAWPAPAATLAALVRHGLLEPGEIRSRKGYVIQTWTLTETGREVLLPKLIRKRDTPRFLAHCGSVRYRKLPSGRVTVAHDGPAAERGPMGSGDYTSDPGRSIDRDGRNAVEAVDLSVLSGSWFAGALERHAEARDRRERARQLANNARRAA